ncbi:MAG: hypothetical protein KGM15_17495 [Pseudomonadota bacterium]|nr:hypothetical protein [Pseudomonadota bacterium]
MKITLDGVEPKVMRRIVVRSDIRLDRLHLAIQAAMGWINSRSTSAAPDGARPSPMGFTTVRWTSRRRVSAPSSSRPAARRSVIPTTLVTAGPIPSSSKRSRP